MAKYRIFTTQEVCRTYIVNAIDADDACGNFGPENMISENYQFGEEITSIEEELPERPDGR